MNSRAAVLMLLVLLMAGCALAEVPAPLMLSIAPARDSYNLDEAGAGGVTIDARFVNHGETELFVVHPAASVPGSYDGSGSFQMDERHGKSEILLLITKPGGEEMVLRHNCMRGFEPGNTFGLKVGPGETASVTFGWLGPYFALGMWDDIREPIFTQRGDYRIRMLYRNTFKKALSFGTGSGIFMDYVPWTGELESNTVIVTVK